jgi:hypothetical protein
MKRTINLGLVLATAVAICFALVPLLQSAPPPHANPGAKPIWEITRANWVKHTSNPRFYIYDPLGDSDPDDPDTCSDDVVLDKVTGLVWPRDASLYGYKEWQEAIDYCRHNLTMTGHKGWRLPTVEELSSLIDLSQVFPTLPSGHPFVYVENSYWWSSTTYESDSSRAWGVSVYYSNVYDFGKNSDRLVWPVRGGNGYATGNW